MTSGDHIIRNGTTELRGILEKTLKEKRPLTEGELRECNHLLQDIEYCFNCMHEHSECLISRLASFFEKKEK